MKLMKKKFAEINDNNIVCYFYDSLEELEDVKEVLDVMTNSMKETKDYYIDYIGEYAEAMPLEQYNSYNELLAKLYDTPIDIISTLGFQSNELDNKINCSICPGRGTVTITSPIKKNELDNEPHRSM